MSSPGFRMGDLRPAIPEAPKADNITETIGKAFVNKMLADLTTNAVQTASPGVGQVRELMGALKDADELTDRRERRRQERLAEELEDLREDIRRLAKAKAGGGDETLGLLLQALLKQSDEKLTLFMQQQQAFLELLMRERDKDKGSSEDFFRQIGLQQIQQALQADPIEAYERQRQYWETRLGADVGESKSLKEWELKEKYALERRKLELEEAKALKESEDRTRGLQTLGQVVASLQQARTGGADQEAAETVAPGGVPGLYDYTCAACGHRWLQPTLEPELVCPKCQTHLSTGAGASPAGQEVAHAS